MVSVSGLGRTGRPCSRKLERVEHLPVEGRFPKSTLLRVTANFRPNSKRGHRICQAADSVRAKEHRALLGSGRHGLRSARPLLVTDGARLPGGLAGEAHRPSHKESTYPQYGKAVERGATYSGQAFDTPKGVPEQIRIRAPSGFRTARRAPPRVYHPG